jgi:cutinase
MHTALQALDKKTKDKLLGGVLFGDTLNQRNKHQIPGYPANRVKEYCATGDGICEIAFRGITGAHLAYGTNGMDKMAVDFLVSKIENNGGGEGGGEVKEAKGGSAPSGAGGKGPKQM